MCAIAGYFGKGDEGCLNKMIDSMSYRGPDDKGIYIDGGVGLAQRRLSIIDLSSAGHQPMSNEDGKVWVIFNGEIYNFLELKKELKRKHDFKSNSDTEVIVHLYEEIGSEVFSKLQGMFSIAIYDKNLKKIFLARDRMGKKPLYWGVHNGDFIFGSELKALINHPSFIKKISIEALDDFLFNEHVPTPNSIFENTYKLEPGIYLTYDGLKIEKKAFWNIKFTPKNNNFSDSLVDLDSVLKKAVSDRLVADVPLGVFLSGGLDSSAIAYYASKMSKEKIKTFSIGFENKSFDESMYAREVSKFLSTDHHEKILSSKDVLELIPEIFSKLDEPIADASIIPTYLLSKFTKQNVTVALSGDGGDELFCGYDTFLAHKLSPLYSLLSNSFINNFIRRLVNNLPTSFSNMSFDFKVKKFINDFDKNPLHRNQKWLSAFSVSDRKELFSNKFHSDLERNNQFKYIDSYLKESDSKDVLDNLSLIYQRTYMMDQVLVKVDRASMMNSLEVRSPFLDTSVVDLVNHMPASFKIHFFVRKYILKKLMYGKLPKNIIYRKKKGFGIPVAEWINGDLKPMVLKYLGKENINRQGIFNPEYVRVLLENHFNGSVDNKKKIWTLLCFSIWYDNFIKNYGN